jgi:hypothetical protein
MKLKNKKAEQIENNLGDILFWAVFIIVTVAATIYIFKLFGGLG